MNDTFSVDEDEEKTAAILSINPDTDIFDRSYDSRKLLDAILSEIPVSPPPKKKSYDRYDSAYETVYLGNGSEVKSFMVLVRNQTSLIILGCILSLLVLVALVFSMYRIRKNLYDSSVITLIAHYEYDGHGQRTPHQCSDSHGPVKVKG
jgi:hypothetical protein